MLASYKGILALYSAGQVIFCHISFSLAQWICWASHILSYFQYFSPMDLLGRSYSVIFPVLQPDGSVGQAIFCHISSTPARWICWACHILSYFQYSSPMDLLGMSHTVIFPILQPNGSAGHVTYCHISYTPAQWICRACNILSYFLYSSPMDLLGMSHTAIFPIL